MEGINSINPYHSKSHRQTIPSYVELDESTLWNLFGLDLDVVVRSLSVASSLGGPGRKQLLEVDMQLMWTGAALVLFLGTIGYTVEVDRVMAVRLKIRKQEWI